jgi:hypothetical protein
MHLPFRTMLIVLPAAVAVCAGSAQPGVTPSGTFASAVSDSSATRELTAFEFSRFTTKMSSRPPPLETNTSRGLIYVANQNVIDIFPETPRGAPMIGTKQKTLLIHTVSTSTAAVRSTSLIFCRATSYNLLAATRGHTGSTIWNASVQISSPSTRT